LAAHILTFQPIKANFLVVRNYPKIDKFYSWNQQSSLKCQLLCWQPVFLLRCEKWVIWERLQWI